MSHRAYYNEIDPFAAAWLRELIKAGHIAPGDVDERSIAEVQPRDLDGYTQCHFFAGIAIWSYALRQARYPDDLRVWTGSCPCQPFSAAGKRKGFADERHLWPEWFRLIKACKPPLIFGEQVSEAVGTSDHQVADMLALQDRKIFKRVLLELQGSLPHDVQRMLQGQFSKDEAHGPGKDQCGLQSVARSEAGLCAGECGALASGETKHTVRHHWSGHSGAYRERLLRGDWHIVRSETTSRLERTVAGSDSSGKGLYSRECQSDTVCPQCHVEHMGSRADCADFQRDFVEEETDLKRIIEEIGGEDQAENGCSWFDAVQTNLEGENYTVRACDTCAAGYGAPHIRQRLYWVANTKRWAAERQRYDLAGRPQKRTESGYEQIAEGGGAGGMGHAKEHGRRPERIAETGFGENEAERSERRIGTDPSGQVGRLADAYGGDTSAEWKQRSWEHRQQSAHSGVADGQQPGREATRGATGGLWSNPVWIPCFDGKLRPVPRATESELVALANGYSADLGCVRLNGETVYAPLIEKGEARTMRLRGYGNSIVASQAAAFIEAALETMPQPDGEQ